MLITVAYRTWLAAREWRHMRGRFECSVGLDFGAQAFTILKVATLHEEVDIGTRQGNVESDSQALFRQRGVQQGGTPYDFRNQAGRCAHRLRVRDLYAFARAISGVRTCRIATAGRSSDSKNPEKQTQCQANIHSLHPRVKIIFRARSFSSAKDQCL